MNLPLPLFINYKMKKKVVFSCKITNIHKFRVVNNNYRAINKCIKVVKIIVLNHLTHWLSLINILFYSSYLD